MNYKITEKIICLPPYLSTTWDQITFLQTEKGAESDKLILVIHMSDGKVIKIPDLEPPVIDIIFSSHTHYLEKKGKLSKESKPQNPQAAFFQNALGLSPEQLSQLSIRFGPGGTGNIASDLEGMESAMQHDPSKANSPNLPKEMLDKISHVAKILTGGDLNGFPKAEPHCNCIHCQLARAIHNGDKEDEEQHSPEEQETVEDEDLKFREWDIKQTGDNLYRVTNPLDSGEKYDVFLGSPVGCTCGTSHCEHLKAVLFS